MVGVCVSPEAASATSRLVACDRQAETFHCGFFSDLEELALVGENLWRELAEKSYPPAQDASSFSS